MSRGTQAIIDLAALRHNFNRVKQQLSTDVNVLTVVKADGYGHGLLPVARELAASTQGFGVATFAEAKQLRDAGLQNFILLLEGPMSGAELQEAAEQGFGMVIHHRWQFDLFQATKLPAPVTIWLKVETGMNRLGLSPGDALLLGQQLAASPQVNQLLVMSHLACADDPSHPLTPQQLQTFTELQQQLQQRNPGQFNRASLANSAAVNLGPSFHFQWVRPGLMLYGACPWITQSAATMDLLPVMQLQAAVIALKTVPAGDTVGYGGVWRASKDTPVAVVSIGYGDGYPRHLAPGAFVLIEGVPCPLIGRVSMDMLTVDVSRCPQVNHQSPVTLWGPGLPVEQVAHWANSVNYELLCQVTARVPRNYVNRLT